MIKKKIIQLLISVMMVFILCGCRASSLNNRSYDTDKVVFIKENLDYKKDIIISSVGTADYAIKPPKDSIELYNMSESVFSGKVISSELRIDKETGFTNTIIKLQKEDLFKGKIEKDEISLIFTGGYISGEKYIEIHPDFKIGILKGFDENEEKAKLEGKIVRVGGMAGEEIPVLGKRYLVFLDPHKLELDGVGYYNISGFEFAQGIFEINNGKIRDFIPSKREAAFNRAVREKLSDENMLKLMKNSTDEVDINKFINLAKGLN